MKKQTADEGGGSTSGESCEEEISTNSSDLESHSPGDMITAVLSTEHSSFMLLNEQS
jgi:hypothetical protein